MDMIRKLKIRKGFTVIEMVVVLVIISVILLAVVPLGQTATDSSRIANAIASIKAIQTASVEWASDNGGVYTGITFAKLAAGYLPAQFTAITTNPWNGDYTVNVDANNSQMLDIGLTAVPAIPAAKLTTALTKISALPPSYTASSQTWTTTLQ
ncbi:MAG: prepilin-type N-terminal cleavage/methylation domain-containing protein [Candidatus Omnitrophica bacterium]|nr:prepilin-type N-terminal cleavage/methylation domain-containing protein [Candidatus Omnitrophota bacterium]